MDSGYGRHSRASTLKLCLMSLTTWTIPKKLALVSRSRPRRWPRGQAKINHFCALPDVGIQERCVRCDAGGRDRHERIVSVRKSVAFPPPDSTQPRKKAKQPASTNEKAHAKRDREAPRTPAGAKVSKPAVPEQSPDAVSQKALEAAPAAVASPRADEQPLNDESRGGSLLATAGAAWPVSPITQGAAGTPAATSTNTADASSNAVQVVDPNEINELDRAASVESSWVNYLLWMLGAALAAAFAIWFFSRMRFLFGRRTANAG